MRGEQDTDLVKVSAAAVVEEALGSAPSRIVLNDRMGEERLWLEGNNSYFGTGSDLPYTRDLETGERRPSVLADVARAARLVDYLPNVDFAMSMAQASDVPVETSDRRSFLAMVENTSKPIVYTAWDEAGLADILAMAETIVGGADRLAESPFLLAYLEPTSPLQHSDVVLRKLLLLADRGLPFVYAPGPIEGASAPVTSAGSLAMANAEVLSGLVIAQLRRPGTPFLFGSGAGPLDMQTTVATYSSPEFMLHCKAMAELAHRRYELPVWGFSGCTDSKLPDIQAGIDAAMWILWTAMSGANLVHDLGYIESGLTCSLEMIVASDEIISFVRRLMAGFEITPRPWRSRSSTRSAREAIISEPTTPCGTSERSGHHGSSTAAPTPPGSRRTGPTSSAPHARSPSKPSATIAASRWPQTRSKRFARSFWLLTLELVRPKRHLLSD